MGGHISGERQRSERPVIAQATGLHLRSTLPHLPLGGPKIPATAAEPVRLDLMERPSWIAELGRDLDVMIQPVAQAVPDIDLRAAFFGRQPVPKLHVRGALKHLAGRRCGDGGLGASGRGHEEELPQAPWPR